MKLSTPNILINDEDGFNSDLDIFHRKEFGERLANIVESIDENFVIALDAVWGEGKSTFIKMWKGYIGSHRDKKIKSIYFDAFENDYQKDPFLIIAAEIYNLIEDKSETKKAEFIQKASNAAKSLTRGAIKIGVKAISSGFLDDSLVDAAKSDISKLLSGQVDHILLDKFKNTKKDRMAIKQFKEYLENFALENGNGLPIVFIIDELDRCRPDFALELLEKIKHLFSVNGIVFMLVMNREQLEASIKSSYGTGIKASIYLQKFINLWVTLPRKSGIHKDHGVQYMDVTLNKMLSEGEIIVNTDAQDCLSELIRYLKPSYREIERILSYFAIIHNATDKKKFNKSYQMIISFLCFLKASNPNLLTKISDWKTASADIISEAGLQFVSTEVDSEYYYIHDLVKLIIYDLSSDLTKDEIKNENELPEIGRIPSNIMFTVCNWLAEMDNVA